MISLAVIKNIVLMLSITLCTILIAIFFLKHLKKLAPAYLTDIEIVGMTNLWNKHKVVLLKTNGIKILIGMCDSQVQTLYVFDKDPITSPEITNTTHARKE